MVQWIRDISNKEQVKEVIDGLCRQFDNFGTLTLTANATSSVVKSPRIKSGITKVFLQAETASASAATGVYVVVANGQFTVFHNSNAATDRRFSYVFYGG